MKRSLLVLFVVIFSLTGVISLATLVSVPAVQAVPVMGETAVATNTIPAPPAATTVITEPHLLLAKSSSYYDEANVDIVNVTGFFVDEFKAWDRYQTGEFDTILVSSDIISDVKASGFASDLVTTTNLSTNYYGFSMDVPPFDDPLVRAAFASALNRQNMIDAVGGDEPPTLTFTPPGAFGYVDGYATGIGRPYSPTDAVNLLTASGYTGNPTITMMVPNFQNHIDMANAARQEWFATLGISVTLVVKEWSEYLDLLNNGAAADRPGIFRMGWGADYPDANNFLNDSVLGSNLFRYDNPVYEALLSAAKSTTDTAVRADLYKQAESYLVMTDTVIAPINNYISYDLTRPTLNRTYRPFNGQHIDDWFFPVSEDLEVAWGEPRTLDPVYADETTIINYVEQLFLGLTDFDPVTGEVVPELATSWDVSASGQAYTFTMRSDAFWTDGNPVTAYDVVYGIQRTKNPDTGADYAQFLLEPIVTVQALDATHVRFDLAEPTAYFPALMTTGPARPQPQWAIEAHGDAWTRPENIVSNGPYQLIEWESAPHLRIEKFVDGPPGEGGNLSFRIQYWNDGGKAADDVVITDTLLSGMMFIMDTAPFPSSGTGGVGDPLVWDLGTLPPYSYGEFEVFVQVTAVQSETITNTVQIATATPENMSESWELEYAWSDFVDANKTDLKLPTHRDFPFAGPGMDLTYILNAINGTGDPPNDTAATASSHVTISATLHPSLTLQSWWSADDIFWDDSNSLGQTLVWERPSFTGYGNSSIYVIVHLDENAPPGLEISFSSSITASNDVNPDNNQGSPLIDYVVDYTDLMVTMSDDPDPVLQGEWLTYTLTVNNNGSVTASNVILTDTLPAGSIFIQAMPVCTEASGIVTCNLDTIPPLGTAFVTVVVQPMIPGEAFNFAEVTAFEYDPNKANNAFGLGTAVLESATIPGITDVQPNYGEAITVTIYGYNFEPGTTVTLNDIPLTTVNYLNNMQLEAFVPAGIPAGTYDVWVKNPGGETGVLLDGFTVIPSGQSPIVTAVLPSQGANNIPIVVDIFGANFAPGGAAVLLPDYIPLGGVQFINSSHLRAVVPSLIATGVYTLEVANPDENSGQLPNAYTAFDPALSTDLYASALDFWVSPLSIRLGDVVTPQLGLNIHRQGGLAALSSVDVDFYVGPPGGNLIGRSQAFSLAPDSVRTTVPLAWTPTSAGTFTLYAVIDPDDAVAESIESNNIISRTITVLPPLPSDITPPVITNFTINDGATSTSQKQVVLDVTATDVGSGVESVLFVEYEYVQSVGGWVPGQMSDWLPYADANVDYPWALLPSPGVHYLQVWGADAAGNISAPFSQFIGYQPDVIDISAGQIHVYRERLTLGAGLQVRLTVLDGGTVDFYVWRPDASLVQLVEGVNIFEEIVFTADMDGVYQIEVEAQTNANYRLEIIPMAGPTAVPHILDDLKLDGILRARGQPFLLPDDEPGDDVGLPDAPSNVETVMLPIILKD